MLSCSLNSISEHGSQNQVVIAAIGFDFIGGFDQPPHLLKSGLPQRHRGHGGRFLMIQSGLRRAVAASAAQAGGGDWIINTIPAYRQAGLRE